MSPRSPAQASARARPRGTKFMGAGFHFRAPTGRSLYVLRSEFPRRWELPGGHREAGETPVETARRETKEELSFVPKHRIMARRPTPAGKRGPFWTFEADVEEEFAPTLSEEHVSFAWMHPWEARGQTLHPKLAKSLRAAGGSMGADPLAETSDITTYRVGSPKGGPGTFFGNRIKDWEGTRLKRWSRDLPTKGSGVLVLRGTESGLGQSYGDGQNAPLAAQIWNGTLPVPVADHLRELASDPHYSRIDLTDAIAAVSLKEAGVDVVHVVDPKTKAMVSVDFREHTLQELQTHLDKEVSKTGRKTAAGGSMGAMRTPEDLPEGYAIEVYEEQGALIYFIYTKDGNRQWTGSASEGGMPSGYVAITSGKIQNYGNCLDGYYVKASDAASGWGPMLYDLAMEWATHHGGGLTADRSSVSKDAHAVWQYYDKNRPDIESAQLDIGSHSTLKQLTPDDPSDDCGQHASIVWAEHSAEGEWYDAPTSRLFRSKGNPTMEKLVGLGKLNLDGSPVPAGKMSARRDPPKAKQVSAKNPYLFDLDPFQLVPTETGQKPENVAGYKGDKSKPILATKIHGKHYVLDGHHRTLVARHEDRPVRAVVIPHDAVEKMRTAGIHQAEMFSEFTRMVMRGEYAGISKPVPGSMGAEDDEMARLLAEGAEERKARQPIRVKIAMRHKGRLRWGQAVTAPSWDKYSGRISPEDQLAWARMRARGLRRIYDEEGPADIVVGIFQGRRLLEKVE